MKLIACMREIRVRYQQCELSHFSFSDGGWLVGLGMGVFILPQTDETKNNRKVSWNGRVNGFIVIYLYNQPARLMPISTQFHAPISPFPDPKNAVVRCLSIQRHAVQVADRLVTLSFLRDGVFACWALGP